MKIPDPHRHRYNRRCGFTFIETIMILGIMSIMLPMIFSILMTVAQQQNKIYRLTEAKTEGDFAMAFMKQRLKNEAEMIFKDETLQLPVCADTDVENIEYTAQKGRHMYFTKRNTAGSYIQFMTEEFGNLTSDNPYEQIIFNDNGQKTALTSENVVISNFEITCFSRTTATPPTIMISFIVYYKTDLSTASAEDTAILEYRGVVKMR
ncbi:MAG: hypothetical protein N2691_04015 [Patescibacteria group bacterium]|nr:hypothetical protein [Patescibacteria group bacterium]